MWKYFLISLLVASSTAVLAEKSDYWMLMDFEAYHGALLDRCRQAAPDALPALQAAITEWQRRNGESSLWIRRWYLNGAKTARDKELLTGMDTAIRDNFAKMPVTEQNKVCTGYPASIQSAEYDLKTKVDAIRASQANQPPHKNN